jgi:membrane-associated protease RseP (regulator of RpoE activity)
MRRYRIHIILFVLTVASTWITGGPSYSTAVMIILLGHEMGHYFMSRKYGIPATLPFFLPLPYVSPFGTLGAVIRMKGVVASRKALFDTGVAGPLISFVLSIPAIIIGIRLSTIIPLPQIQTESIRLADPLLFSIVQHFTIGDIPKNYDVILHPIGFAGWVGLFVTALNLLPVGQLDGGHIAYALFGKKSRIVFVIAIAVVAFFFLFYSMAWFLILILMILFGLRHPEPAENSMPLDWKRKLIGVITFVALILSFTPSPFPEAPSFIGLIQMILPMLQKFISNLFAGSFLFPPFLTC